MTQSAPSPVSPSARTIRPVLRAAGIEKLVQRVTSSRKYTRVYVPWTSTEQAEYDGQQIADAIRHLWNDERIYVVPVTGTVVITRARWYRTRPASAPSGKAAIARINPEIDRKF